jgi:hypothetical protein
LNIRELREGKKELSSPLFALAAQSVEVQSKSKNTGDGEKPLKAPAEGCRGFLYGAGRIKSGGPDPFLCHRQGSLSAASIELSLYT